MRIAAAVSVNEEKDRLQAAGTSELHKATWLPGLDSLCILKIHYFLVIRIQVIPWKLQSQIQQHASYGVNSNHVKAGKSV